MNKQTSNAVYGLFCEDIEKNTLLGLYSSRESADVACKEYIEEEIADYNPDKLDEVRSYYQKFILVRRLEIGQSPSRDYSYINC
jgi:hypothetical protein